MVVVRLSCSNPEELARRVAMPERRLRFKETDTVGARRHAPIPTLDPGHADTISIETGRLSAEDVAQRIISELKI